MVSFPVRYSQVFAADLYTAQEMKFGDNAEDVALAEDVEGRDRREVSR